jgi:hypothetical protein
MRADNVAVRSNATFGQPALDRDQERGFLEIPDQVPYPIERDLLQQDHVGIDLDHPLGDAPAVEAALSADTVMRVAVSHAHRRVLFIQPERNHKPSI